jgi:mono/diheme cytochrome c family protein
MSKRILTAVMILGTGLMLPGRGICADDGAAVFKEQCAKCHGDTGDSDTSAGKSLKVPLLKGNAKLAGMPLADIAKAVTENEKHKSIVKKLTPEQLNAAAGRAQQLAGGK